MAPEQLRYTLRMRKSMPKSLIFPLLSCLLLAACGNKGPLVRPQDSKVPEQVPSEPETGR